MKNEDLEHLIRAAGAILGDHEVVVIGSQSILPWLRKREGVPPKNYPSIFKFSMEADIAPIDGDPKKSDEIDGSLGEDSLFHHTCGYYAQGVSLKTARAPKGWLSRCYALENANTWQVIGRCMHPNDLFIAKLLANRPKDRPFLEAMIASNLVRKASVLHGLPQVPDITPEELEIAQKRLVPISRRTWKSNPSPTKKRNVCGRNRPPRPLDVRRPAMWTMIRYRKSMQNMPF